MPEFSNYVESLDPAADATGTILIPVSRNGDAEKMTPAQIVEAGGAGSGAVESIVAGANVTVDDSDPANPIVSAAGGAVDSVNGQTGVVELDAFDVDADNGAPVVSTTGTAIAFAVPQFYASAGTPATGNVTLVTTGLVPGMVQVLYHEDSGIPTFPSEFIRISGFYITNTLNIIYMHAISASRVEYMIFQEL